MSNIDNNKKPNFSVSGEIFPRIHPEGRRFGLIALVVFGIFSWLSYGYFALTGLLLTYAVMLFFRDPDRYPPEDKSAVVSPADGRICCVRKCRLPKEISDSDEEFWRVSIFMSVLNVHINRMPVSAVIKKKVHVQGKFFNASLDKASEDNERCIYLAEIDGGQTMAFVQIAGLVARRIVPFVSEGDKLARAERFGLIRFGSRLEVYLPAGVEPRVLEGQTTVAGETILANLPQ